MPRELPSSNPLFNYDLKDYTVKPKPKQKLVKDHKEFTNEIAKINEATKEELKEQQKFRKFLKTKARMFNDNFNSQKFTQKIPERILSTTKLPSKISNNEKDFFSALY